MTKFRARKEAATMAEDNDTFLLALCDAVHQAHTKATKRERRGSAFTEYLIMRHDKVKVELRKEKVSHNEPHIHITHSDKIVNDHANRTRCDHVKLTRGSWVQRVSS